MEVLSLFIRPTGPKRGSGGRNVYIINISFDCDESERESARANESGHKEKKYEKLIRTIYRVVS